MTSLTKSMLVSVAVLVAAASGCKKSRKVVPAGSGAGASPTPAATAAPAALPAAVPVAGGAVAVAREPVPTVPVFSADPVSQVNQDKAESVAQKVLGPLVHDGLPEDVSEVRTLLTDLAQALTLAPGNVLARYSFACVLSLRGESAAAAAQLAQLKQAGCPECLSALANLRPEGVCSWGTDPAIEAVRKDLAISRLHAAAEVVIAALETGATDKMQAVLDPKGKVEATDYDTNGDHFSETNFRETLKGAKAVTAWVAAHKPKDDGSEATGAEGPMFCSGSCCTVDNAYSRDHKFIESLCFTPGPAPKLTSVKLTSR